MPAISRPTRSAVASSASKVARKRPSYMTATRSLSASTSSRSAEISKIAVPLSRSARRRLPDVFGRAYVHSASWLTDNEDLRLAREGPRDDHLLLIAT